MIRYRVLWIDDEWKKQEEFISFAEQLFVDITPFEFVEDGLNELNKNLSFYHAVILDAKVKLGSSDQTAKLDGLTIARDRMLKINEQQYLPYFIYTGVPDYHKAEWFKSMVQEYYIKPQDRKRLIELLKEKVDKKDEYVVEKEFHHVFQACTDEYLGQDSRERILRLIEFLKGPNVYSEDIFNPIRKVVESGLRLLNKYGFLHDKCIQTGDVNITWSNLFFSGKEVKLPDGTMISTIRKYPEIISSFLFQLKDITNVGSHDEERESNKAKINELRKYSQAPYLAKSLIFQALEFIAFCIGLISKSPDREMNIKDWIESGQTFPLGIIEQDADGNYHCDEYFLSKMWVENNGYKIGDTIEILDEDTNTQPRTRHIFSKFAKKFRKKT